MSELLEIRWDALLEERLMRWLALHGQFRALTAADVATPEMVELTGRRRHGEALDAIRRLRTELESRRVAVLDCGVIEEAQKLSEKCRGRVAGGEAAPLALDV